MKTTKTLTLTVTELQILNNSLFHSLVDATKANDEHYKKFVLPLYQQTLDLLGQ